MPKLKFNLTTDPAKDTRHVTLYHGAKVLQANNTHPNWGRIYDGLFADDAGIVDLFDIAETLSRKVLSERVSIANGRIYFDNDEVHDALADLIVAIVTDSDSDVNPWVKLMEKIATNPNEDSRKHLYRHLKSHQYTITQDGDFVAYKGVKESPAQDGEDTTYLSLNSGPAIVNGTIHKGGPVPNIPGSVIEMARSEVTFDPHNTCAKGLHVANWRYVSQMYGGNAQLEVHVNPRDVVSVPSDYGDGKVRVCRYRVVGPVTAPYKTPVLEAKVTVGVKGIPAKLNVELVPSSAKLDKTAEPKVKETAVSTTTVKRARYPRPADWDEIVDRAKRRKQNLVKFVSKMTEWSKIDGREGTDRKDWSV